eukprot:TRINITY_DN5812_c0_g1_i2.p1 TRINITY_DN5812_c0_g1~~TRINITY_DN5812_c0_g1_i2.p1  ORF type:complete len:198 (-),score=28.16 TRINITY_DN5812_c0_g1_i2:8-601(-)
MDSEFIKGQLESLVSKSKTVDYFTINRIDISQLQNIANSISSTDVPDPSLFQENLKGMQEFLQNFNGKSDYQSTQIEALLKTKSKQELEIEQLKKEKRELEDQVLLLSTTSQVHPSPVRSNLASEVCNEEIRKIEQSIIMLNNIADGYHNSFKHNSDINSYEVIRYLIDQLKLNLNMLKIQFSKLIPPHIYYNHNKI